MEGSASLSNSEGGYGVRKESSRSQGRCCAMTAKKDPRHESGVEAYQAPASPWWEVLSKADCESDDSLSSGP